ncbi:MAG: SHOCT domain-containing protein [Solirubrobacterales bacterium]
MASTDPPESRHRIKVRILVVLASILAFLAIFTTWIDRQLLDTDQWVKTSGEMLEEEVISDAVADYAVDQLFAKVNVAKTLDKRLPEDLKPLAGPISGGARELGTRAAEQALQSPRVQALWRDANRAAHSQLVAILKDDTDTVSTQEGRVILDLRPIVLQLAQRIGVEKQAEERLPENIAELDIADSEQLDTARTITRALEGLAWLFLIGTLVLFALAAYLAKGRRWVVVLGYGLGVIAASLAAIALKNVASGLVIDSLAKTEAARPPAEEAWTIATSLLQSIATTGIVYGVLFVLASYLASPANSAVAIRQALAPSLRERPGVVWGAFGGVVFLALIAWPPDGTRQLIFTLALIGLAAAGLEALSRKTAHEFPDARRGDWLLDIRQRARRTSAQAGKRITSAMRELTEDRDPDDALLDRLERLGELKERGILSAAEFREQKKRMIGEANGGGPKRTGAKPKPKPKAKAKAAGKS